MDGVLEGGEEFQPTEIINKDMHETKTVGDEPVNEEEECEAGSLPPAETVDSETPRDSAVQPDDAPETDGSSLLSTLNSQNLDSAEQHASLLETLNGGASSADGAEDVDVGVFAGGQAGDDEEDGSSLLAALNSGAMPGEYTVPARAFESLLCTTCMLAVHNHPDQFLL